MTTDSGGWIVFQRRVSADVDFYLNWTDYKNGFGNFNGSFWLGLEKLYQLTKPGKRARLRIDLIVSNASSYARYSRFEMGGEPSGYNMSVSGYSGNAVDIMQYHSGMKFRTKDKDSEENCAALRKGGWWHNRWCDNANLNGIYKVSSKVNFDVILWESRIPVAFSEMKIK